MFFSSNSASADVIAPEVKRGHKGDCMRREQPKTMHVYVMSGHNRRLYTGVTSDLERRVWEHRMKLLPGFTSRYNFHKLVFYEVVEGPHSAIEREKQIKGWNRQKKLALIEGTNPQWEDLSAGWSDDSEL